MNTGMIPVRYAKALLEFAYEKKCAEQVYAEMSAVAGSFEREHALRRVLDNPVLPVDKKTELIRTAGGGRTSEVFDRFVWLVLHNRRERYLQSISLMYLDLYRKLNRISTGRLETAVPVTPETERKIIDLIAWNSKRPSNRNCSAGSFSKWTRNGWTPVLRRNCAISRNNSSKRTNGLYSVFNQ